MNDFRAIFRRKTTKLVDFIIGKVAIIPTLKEDGGEEGHFPNKESH